MTAEIEDTYAEAFEGYYSRILITAKNKKWLMAAANSVTGYATSGIGCDCEAGIGRLDLAGEDTPDGRPGATVHFWVPSWIKDTVKTLESEVLHRVGQCVLTAPTTAVWNATESSDTIQVGRKLAFFADGFQTEEKRHGRIMVNIPRMMGEFLIEKEIGYAKGVMGGNLWFFGDTEDSALEAAENATDAISQIEGAVTTFPGGVCSSGSKIGSRYSFLTASTNITLCPTIKDKVENSMVPGGVNSISEIVINGISEDVVRAAMHESIKAARDTPGLVKISAGNYGGKLGKYKIYLLR